MNEALVLNNNAILYLQMGNAFEACNLLTEASNICLHMTDGIEGKKRVKHRDNIITWINFSCGNFDNAKRDASDCPPAMYQYAPAVRKTCCHEEFTAERKYCHECFDDSSVCPCSIAPIIWYNLALSCQILGTELGGETKDGMFYFMRSTYLYEKVLDICGKDHQSQGLATLLIAVLNNQACIYYEIGRHDECSTLMQRLQNSLRSVSRPSLQRNWGVFHMNMIMMDSARRRPAAAA
jgi:tetratricopeptide (TPR) repeat protein